MTWGRIIEIQLQKRFHPMCAIYTVATVTYAQCNGDILFTVLWYKINEISNKKGNIFFKVNNQE